VGVVDRGESLVARIAGVGRAFRHRNYRLFFTGQLVSLIGTWTQSVAQTWLVYRLTGSALMLGTITFCQQAPVVLFATAGGSVADRWPRRGILVITQATAMVLAFVLAALTISNRVTVPHLLVLAALLGVVNAFDIPVRQSFIVEMVGRDNLMNAVALNSSMVNGARIVGPAIAGFAINAFGEGWCFFVNGVSFGAVIGGLLAMQDLPPVAPRAEGEEVGWARLTKGFGFVAHEPVLRAFLLLFAVTALAGMPYNTLLPIYASKVFHGDARTLGFLTGATGIGAVLGGVGLAARDTVKGSGRIIAGCCGLFGVTIILFAASTTYWLSLVILVPLGAGMMVQLSATNTVLQTRTPDALRGRVMAIWAMIFMGCAPVGSLVAGWLATAIGPARTLYLGGSTCVVAAAIFALWLRRRRMTGPGVKETDSVYPASA
jgi:MFS family permease